MIDDDDPLPPGRLRHRLHDPGLHAAIREADIVRGIHPATGRHAGLFYGIAPVRRVIRRDVAEDLALFEVPVDPDTDDVEVLCTLVKALKGAHCYGAR
jgi:hypothetical protein